MEGAVVIVHKTAHTENTIRYNTAARTMINNGPEASPAQERYRYPISTRTDAGSSLLLPPTRTILSTQCRDIVGVFVVAHRTEWMSPFSLTSVLSTAALTITLSQLLHYIYLDICLRTKLPYREIIVKLSEWKLAFLLRISSTTPPTVRKECIKQHTNTFRFHALKCVIKIHAHNGDYIYINCTYIWSLTL